MSSPKSQAKRPVTCPLPVCLAETGPRGVWDVICAENMVVPCQFAAENLLVVRMDEDGLAPDIRRGAYVGLDRNEKAIRSGRLYGVMSPVEGLVIKRAVVDPRTRQVRLSDNRRDLPPYRFTAEEFARRAVGRVVWVFQEF